MSKIQENSQPSGLDRLVTKPRMFVSDVRWQHNQNIASIYNFMLIFIKWIQSLIEIDEFNYNIIFFSMIF